MKCEICHKNEAEAVLKRPGGGEEDELYVCKECLKAEKLKQQKKRGRTIKVTGMSPGVSMSIHEISASDSDEDGEGDSENPPPIVGAILGAFHDMVSELEQSGEAASEKAEPKYHDFPLGRVQSEYRIGARLHLEGLQLIGELEPVHRALHALGMRLEGVYADGVRDVGHVYSLKYLGGVDRARKVVSDLLREEHNARVRLLTEMPRVMEDALCRALAVLKNCRLLSPAEYFDMLSPLRLAALDNRLDGIKTAEIDRRMLQTDLSSSEDRLTPVERDEMDAGRADEANQRFEEVLVDDQLPGGRAQ